MSRCSVKMSSLPLPSFSSLNSAFARQSRSAVSLESVAMSRTRRACASNSRSAAISALSWSSSIAVVNSSVRRSR